LSLAARVRSRSPEAREALALLGLQGRPAETDLLGGALDELIGAGVVVRRDDFVSLRHALLGEVAAELLDEGERRELHARIARAVTDPGEAARHFALAGDRRAAFEAALEAHTWAIHP